MESAHTQTAPALFFYENMQGNGQLKQQVWPDQENKETPMFPDGNDPNSKGFMDNMPEGTFVEVIGYYKNAVGEGPIIYRFMLGKNITDNYDAQRNYHFKLTLKLKNNGNDNDWHIVYDQEPDIIATVPYYISYLYNQTMDYPIKIVGGELVSLRADIPETIPQEAVDEINDNNPTFHVSADVNKTSWAPKAGEVTHEDELAAEAAGGVNVYWDGAVNDPGPWNGFLSLRKTEVSQFGLWQNPDGTKDEDFGPNGSKTYTYNKTYWDENNRGWRVYDVKTMGLHRDATDGDYTISRTAPGEYTATLPLYTRARVMVSQTGYSGNNPYAAYQRMAVIKVTAKIKRFGSDKIEEIEKYLPVIQSRRVLNPKAIWRESHNKDPFHVQLKILPYQTASSFEPLKSDGPWRAEIQSGNWFELIPTAGVSQKNPDGSISGVGNPYDMDNNPGCAIDFTFKPNGTIGDNETQGGIIRIYYNNYSCVHTIFVRQGYAPVSFYNSNTMWHTSNLRTGGYENGVDIGESYEAPDPELEGAYFKKYNRRYPISAAANTRQWALVGSQTTGTYAGNPYTERTFPVITKAQIGANSATEMKWEDIKTDENSWKAFSKVIDVTGTSYANCRLPKAADWEEIINNPKTIYGFGVLYADGATETLEDIDLVYGATPEDHNSGRGMRGVIICDESVGTQIFLPTAATGYGRFKQLSPEERYNRLPKGHGGVIQYANRYTWYPQYANGDTNYGVGYHPLFYDLWQSEGTMYWLDENKALDINFNTLDFVVGNQDDLGLVWTWAGIDNSGTDAVHLRLVHDRPGSAAAARTAARTRAAKAKVVSKPKAFSKTRR